MGEVISFEKMTSTTAEIRKELQAVKQRAAEQIRKYNDKVRMFEDSYNEEIDQAGAALDAIDEEEALQEKRIEEAKRKLAKATVANDTGKTAEAEAEIRDAEEQIRRHRTRREAVSGMIVSGDRTVITEAEDEQEEILKVFPELSGLKKKIEEEIRKQIDELTDLRSDLETLIYPKVSVKNATSVRIRSTGRTVAEAIIEKHMKDESDRVKEDLIERQRAQKEAAMRNRRVKERYAELLNERPAEERFTHQNIALNGKTFIWYELDQEYYTHDGEGLLQYIDKIID